MAQKTKAELQTWIDGLVKAGSLDETAAKALSGSLEKPEVVEYVGGSVLRQEDYSRHQNQLAEDRKTQEKEYESKNSEVDRFRNSLVTFKTETDDVVKKANDRATVAEQARTAQTQRFKTLGEQYGVEASELEAAVGAGSPSPSNLPVGGGPPNGGIQEDTLKGYVKSEDFNKGARQAVDLTATLNDMADAHFDLFGKRLSRKELVDEAIAAGKTIAELWESKYNVTARREQLATETQEKHDKDLVEKTAADTEARVRSELHIPPQRKPDEGQTSPVLDRKFKPDIGPETPESHQQRVMAAVAAHNEGKYRPEAPRLGSGGGGQ